MVSVRFVRVFAPRAAGSPEQELRHLDQVDHERSAGAPRAAGSPEQELRRRHDQLSLEAVGEPRAAGSPEQELRHRRRLVIPAAYSGTPSRRFTRTGIETGVVQAMEALQGRPEPQVHQNRN